MCASGKKRIESKDNVKSLILTILLSDDNFKEICADTSNQAVFKLQFSMDHRRSSETFFPEVGSSVTAELLERNWCRKIANVVTIKRGNFRQVLEMASEDAGFTHSPESLPVDSYTLGNDVQNGSAQPAAPPGYFANVMSDILGAFGLSGET